jgi:signal transduction histidine kinase
MDDPGTRRRFPQRIAVLVGFGALLPLVAILWLGASAVSALGDSLRRERQSVAAAVAARVDEALDARLLALGSLAGALADGAPGEPARVALHDAWRRSRPVESVALFAPDGRELLREPQSAPAAPFRAVQRPSVIGPVATDAGPRVLLVYPLRDYRGQLGAFALSSLDPSEPRWLALVELRPARDDLQLWLEVEDGQPLSPPAALHPPIVARAPLASAPWRVAAGAAATDPASTAVRRLLWLGPALFALLLLFGWGAARSVTDPVAVLTQAAGRLAEGDLERPVPGVGSDEVGQLGAALEQMRVALRRDRSRGKLLERVIAAQEDERRRIARELHDETCQTLAALALAVRGGRPAEAESLVGRSLDGIRALIYDLRPGVLDDLGLTAAIRWLADRHLTTRGIAVRCEIEEPSGRLRPEVETALFRAVQEALVNVARHAEAEAVLIQVGPEGGQLRIEVEDDGRGFDPEAVGTPSPDGRGLGLLGMRERLALVGGKAELDSAPGRGTRVVLVAPLETVR